MGQASERLVSCLGVSVALFVDGRHACMTQSAAALPGQRTAPGGPAGRAGQPTDGRTVECVRWSASNLIILASLMTLARRGHDNDIMPD